MLRIIVFLIVIGLLAIAAAWFADRPGEVALTWEGRASAKNGAIYHQTYCWVMRFENGKVREGTAYLDTDLINQVWK